MFLRTIRRTGRFLRNVILFSLLTITVSVIFPYSLFTDGPEKELSAQYPWLGSDLYYHVMLYSHEYSLDPHFVLALINAESEGKRTALSCVGAIGYMQIMPYHMKDNPARLYQPVANISMGCSYLSYCLRLSGGDMIEALKNYNAGPASKFYNMPYIKKIFRCYLTAKGLYPMHGIVDNSMIVKL